jgi:hypothetical protein
VDAVQSFDFSPAPVGSTNGYVIVSLVNRTSLPLPVTRVSLATGSDFRIEGVAGLPVVLAPGQELPIRVTFEPAHEGSLTDTILVGTSDPNAPSVKIKVSGQGL